MTLLQTPRLVIREFYSADAATIYAYANDPDISLHLGFGSIAIEPGAKEYIETAILNSRKSDRHSYKLAMEIKPSPKVAGSCWLDILDPHSHNASIGYFVDKHEWGKGYASEMVQALLKFGFDKLNLHRIYATCDVDNTVSKRLLEKIGFKQEGLLREHCLRSFGWSDALSYGLLRSEWELYSTPIESL